MKAIRAKTRFSMARAWVRRPVGRGAAMLVVAVATSVAVLGCGDGSADSTSTGPSLASGSSSAQVGSIALDLQIGSEVQLASVAYDISGGGFHRAGLIDVSNSAGASVLVDSVPFGTGYVATMSASSTSSPHVDCGGSASFNVSASGVTAVPVHLTCKETPTTPPPPPTAVPVPPLSGWILCTLLLAAGVALLGRAQPHARRRLG